MRRRHQASSGGAASSRRRRSRTRVNEARTRRTCATITTQKTHSLLPWFMRLPAHAIGSEPTQDGSGGRYTLRATSTRSPGVRAPAANDCLVSQRGLSVSSDSPLRPARSVQLRIDITASKAAGVHDADTSTEPASTSTEPSSMSAQSWVRAGLCPGRGCPPSCRSSLGASPSGQDERASG